jgi:multicomponent Na+:H+ antiporter subunit B
LRRLVLLILIAFAAVMFYGISTLPDRADPHAPANLERSSVDSPVAQDYYIRHAYEDAHTPNMVTVILADYRGYDTLGETVVIVAAGLACFLILRRRRPGEVESEYEGDYGVEAEAEGGEGGEEQ